MTVLDQALKEFRIFVDEMHANNMERFEEMNKAITMEIYSAVKKAISKMSKIVNKA